MDFYYGKQPVDVQTEVSVCVYLSMYSWTRFSAILYWGQLWCGENMPTLSLPLSNLLRNKESFQRLVTLFKYLHTRSGTWSVNTSTLWIRRSQGPKYGLVSRRQGPLGQLTAGNMCTSSSDDKTSWLWSVYNETKRQTQG